MGKLKFSANLGFLFPEVTELPLKYSKAKEAGFTAVECGCDIYSYSTEQLKAACEENALVQVQMNAHVGETKGYACVPGQEANFKSSLELSISYCQALQCERLHIMSGVYSEDPKDLSKEEHTKYRNTFVSNMKEAADRVKGTNIIILIEPISVIPNYFLHSTQQAIEILDELSSPSVKLQLDFFHQQRTGGNLTETFKKFQKYIGHVQVSQVPNRNEPDRAGEINYDYVFHLLTQLNYDDWIGCEYKPSFKTLETFDWMKPYL